MVNKRLILGVTPVQESDAANFVVRRPHDMLTQQRPTIAGGFPHFGRVRQTGGLEIARLGQRRNPSDSWATRAIQIGHDSVSS